VKTGTAPEFPPCDPSTVAPLNKDGKPDMYNFMPTRFITMREAEVRGYQHFYIGESCRHGHRAPRFVSNPRKCVDCKRKENGKPPIGVAGVKEFDGPQAPHPPARQPKPIVGQPDAPSAVDQLFLAKYSELRDFAAAAKACGRTEHEFVGRLSWNVAFRSAVHTLEQDLGLVRTPTLTEDFEWTDDKRKTLIRAYVDTGNMLHAMRAIGVGNYHFTMEMETNPQFRADMERAEALASVHIDREAIDRSLKGDSRLLQRFLAGSMPEKWGEKVQMDLNVTNKLTNEQINARIARLLAEEERLGLIRFDDSTVHDAEFTPVEQEANSSDTGAVGNEETAAVPRDNSDLV